MTDRLLQFTRSVQSDVFSLISTPNSAMNFTYTSHPSRVIFGSGTLQQLPTEITHLNITRPLVLSTPEQTSHAERVVKLLEENGTACAGMFNKATMHTPTHVTDEAIKVVKERNADGVVAIGGGSTTGLGKAIALRTDLKQIVIPTTYAGSEMTPILGETKDGAKTTQTTSKVLPETVIYDVDFTLSLPVGLSATSGLNAIAHAVEALYAKSGNPVISLMAEEGIRALARSLPIIVSDSENKDARSDALYGAWLCGVVLGSVGMALHHKLCHTLGGTFNLPHAETHSIVLPHALSYNAPKVPDTMKAVARALGTDNAVDGLNELLDKLRVTKSLNELGMPEEGVEKAAELAVKNPYWNPREIEQDKLREVIRRAWAGEPARADL